MTLILPLLLIAGIILAINEGPNVTEYKPIVSVQGKSSAPNEAFDK